MDRLTNDLIAGFLLLSFLAGAQGLTKIMAAKASEAYRIGPMSYGAYTRLLTR